MSAIQSSAASAVVASSMRTDPKTTPLLLVYNAEATNESTVAAALYLQTGLKSLPIIAHNGYTLTPDQLNQCVGAKVTVLGTYNLKQLVDIAKTAISVSVVSFKATADEKEFKRIAGLEIMDRRITMITPKSLWEIVGRPQSLVPVLRDWNLEERITIDTVMDAVDLQFKDRNAAALLRGIKVNHEVPKTLGATTTTTLDKIIYAITMDIKATTREWIRRGEADLQAMEKSIASCYAKSITGCISIFYDSEDTKSTFITKVVTARICPAARHLLDTARYVLKQDEAVDICVTWRILDGGELMKFSITSRMPDKVDAGEIARRFTAGGGSTSSAGFALPLKFGYALLEKWTLAGLRQVTPSDNIIHDGPKGDHLISPWEQTAALRLKTKKFEGKLVQPPHCTTVYLGNITRAELSAVCQLFVMLPANIALRMGTWTKFGAGHLVRLCEFQDPRVRLMIEYIRSIWAVPEPGRPVEEMLTYNPHVSGRTFYTDADKANPSWDAKTTELGTTDLFETLERLIKVLGGFDAHMRCYFTRMPEWTPPPAKKLPSAVVAVVEEEKKTSDLPKHAYYVGLRMDPPLKEFMPIAILGPQSTEDLQRVRDNMKTHVRMDTRYSFTFDSLCWNYNDPTTPLIVTPAPHITAAYCKLKYCKARDAVLRFREAVLGPDASQCDNVNLILRDYLPMWREKMTYGREIIEDAVSWCMLRMGDDVPIFEIQVPHESGGTDDMGWDHDFKSNTFGWVCRTCRFRLPHSQKPYHHYYCGLSCFGSYDDH